MAADFSVSEFGGADVAQNTLLAAPFEYTQVKLPLTPPFLRKIGSLAATMGYGAAVSETLHDANVSIELEGELPPTEDGGLIIACDHRQGFEPFLVQAAIGGVRNEGTNIMAMPFSRAGRFIQTSGEHGQNLVIPVVRSDYGSLERSLAEATRQRYRQLRFPDLRRPGDELRAANKHSIALAASRVATGNTVTIFPTGGLVDSIAADWQNGLGKIVEGLPADAHASTAIGVIEPSLFSKKNIFRSLLLRDMGIRPRPQTVIFAASTMGRVGELFHDELHTAHPSSTKSIVAKVKDHYRLAFRANG
jgi:hypothetical protein